MKPDNQELQPTKDKKQNKEKILLIVLGLAILLVGTVVAILLVTKKDNKNNNSNQRNSNNQNEVQQGEFARQYSDRCEKKDSVSFTSYPIPMEQLGSIEPLGKVQDGHVTPTDHQYLAPLNSQAADNTTDVVMPADGKIVEIAAMPAQYIGDRQQQTAPEDHRIVVSFSCQYYSIFIHVHQLAPALKDVVGDLQPNQGKQVDIKLSAGDKIGKIGGNPVDWTMLDTSKELSGFITPSLYQRESWKIHTIDPTNLFTGDLKDKVIAKSLRSTEPYGGKIDYDQAGKLVGNWFQEGTNGYEGVNMERYWDGHLSIAPDYIDANSTVLSIGNWTGKADQFAVKSGPMPEEVSSSTGIVKFELVKRQYIGANGQPWVGSGLVKGIKLSKEGSTVGTVLVQLDGGEKLKLEVFAGKTPNQVSAFTTNARTYTR